MFRSTAQRPFPGVPWHPTRATVLASVAVLCTAIVDAQDVANQNTIEFYERKVRPLLAERCYECHSATAEPLHGGLRIDDARGVERGGDSGPLVTAGRPGASLLLEVLRYDGDIQMPPEGKLSAEEIEVVTRWVHLGAPMPADDDLPDRPDGFIDFEAGKRFWSFQPVERQPRPEIIHRDWPESRIDWFILVAMEREGLSPSPSADRATLARRLHFDVIGLPPTPEAIEAFVNDESPDAYARLVNELLDSPHYGEKWARMWLDMARYTDKTANWLNLNGRPHFYRDWVVKAFNEDMPYNEFIHRQLATDLMEQTGPEDLPALGFLSLSPTYWKELKLPCEIIKVIVADEWEEKVDAVSRTFLGLTVACARCHDHKFDPISSEDYYALAGVFASCHQVERPLIPDEDYEPVKRAKVEVAKLEAELAKLKKQKPVPKEKTAEIEQQIKEIKNSTPLYDTPLTNALAEESLHVVRAGETPQEGTRLDYRPGPQDLPLFVRGNPNRPGPIVPRRFLTVLAQESRPFEQGSGRLELAQAITTDAAPLAARVIVNRIWLAHFGQGLVATPSNFGQQGSRPTHPELLDDLAARFIENGWSIKWLQRQILLSATYQQSSLSDPTKIAADPNNRWLSRMNRRRLDFEAWRDAMLAASGVLDLTVGGPSLNLEDAGNHRRTLYSTVHRRDMSTTLQIHDFPDPNQHSPQRLATTTPLQGLYALNGPLLAQQARLLLERLQREHPDNDPARVDRAYQLLFSHSPTESQRRLAERFLSEDQSDSTDERWEQYLHVLLASNQLQFVD